MAFADLEKLWPTLCAFSKSKEIPFPEYDRCRRVGNWGMRWDDAGKNCALTIQAPQRAHMWLKAHRIVQSRLLKALITLPWVASGRRSGQCRGGSGRPALAGSSPSCSSFVASTAGQIRSGDGVLAQNGTALHTVFTSVGAGSGVTGSYALAWVERQWRVLWRTKRESKRGLGIDDHCTLNAQWEHRGGSYRGGDELRLRTRFGAVVLGLGRRRHDRR